MKKIILIIGLSLLSLIAFADGDAASVSSMPPTSKMEMSIEMLKPITPNEATFEDVDSILTVELIKLSPVTPKEATFEE